MIETSRAGRILTLSFVMALSGAVTPGPMLALVVAQVLARGMGAVWPILLGHALIEAVFLGVLFAGLGAALARPRVRGVLALVGGGALAWMGWSMLRDASRITLTAAEAGGLSWFALLAAGVGVSLANPYFTGWWATVGTGQLASLKVRRWQEIVPFFIGHELGDVAWYVFVAVVLVTGRGWLTDGVYRLLVTGCAAAVLLVALLFLGLGVHTLLAVNRSRHVG